MKKIGFIDYFLDEWHANNYPAWIKEQSGGECVVTYAYAKIDSPLGGLTSAAWAEKHGVELVATIEELIEKSDCIVVLSPDNSELHYELSHKALATGKPVYIDKTFADSAAEARRIFAVAQKYDTPCYSSSALRFSTVVNAIDTGSIRSVTSWGGGSPGNYIIHQLEPLAMLMGTDAEKVMYTGSDGYHSWCLSYLDGRKAYCNVCAEEPGFTTRIVHQDRVETVAINDAFFDAFIASLVEFFRTGKPPVEHGVTVRIMKLRERCLQAMQTPDEWIAVD